MTTRRKTQTRSRDDRRNADPLIGQVVGEPEPERRERLKRPPAGSAPEAAPAAPRNVLEMLRRGPMGVLRVLGPGLITGASDDDPSGIGTYSQVGSQFGYGLLWTALFTFPLMAAMQELC